MTISGRITSLVFVSCMTTIAAFIGTGGVSKALQQHQLTGYETTQPCQEFERNACHQAAQVEGESWGLAFLNGQVGHLPAMAARAGIYSASFLLGGKGGFVMAGAFDMLGALPTSAAASPSSGLVCVNADGIPGIESPDGRACCPASCGQCGGYGCSVLGEASDCCVSMIIEDGEACSDTKEAPCFIDDGDDGGGCADAPEENDDTSWTYEAFKWGSEIWFVVSIVRALYSFYLKVLVCKTQLAARRAARAEEASPGGSGGAATAAATAWTSLLDLFEAILNAFGGVAEGP